MRRATLLAGSAVLALAACSNESMDAMQSDASTGIAGAARNANSLLPPSNEIVSFRPDPNPERNAYFGDLHVHTAYSFDAYVFGTTNTPDDAYRYAKGNPMDHPSGYTVQLQKPMDFYAVTDHAMLMGLVKEAADTSSEFSSYAVSVPLHDINAPDNMNVLSLAERGSAFGTFLPATLNGLIEGTIDRELVESVTKSAWADSVRAANDAYNPGAFTTKVPPSSVALRL